MKKILRIFLITILAVGLLYAPCSLRYADRAQAATDTANPTTGSPGYFIMPFHLTGALTAGTITSVVKFNMPWPAEFLGVYACVRAHTGSQTVNVLNAGTSMISSVITLATAGIVYSGTLSTTAAALKVADEAAVTIDFVTNTSATDTTILLIFKRQ
jgi:hypothetical protein